MENLISYELIQKHPQINQITKNLIFDAETSEWIKDYLNWINGILRTLPPKQQTEIINRISAPDGNKFKEAIAELMFLAIRQKANWKWEKDPVINGKTPDYFVSPEKCKYSFIAEVTVVRHNHPDPNNYVENGELYSNGVLVDKWPIVTDPIEQEKRIVNAVLGKYNKYREICKKYPFFVCLYIYDFKNNFYLTDYSIQKALYYKPDSNDITNGNAKYFGILELEEYSSLDGVIVCREEFIDHEKNGYFKPVLSTHILLNRNSTYRREIITFCRNNNFSFIRDVDDCKFNNLQGQIIKLY